MASNTVVLITGGNSGLGLETVKAILGSPKSYTILLGGRSLEKAEAAAQEVQTQFSQSPSLARAVQIDIENDDSISQAFNLISSQYGRLDILINNAGAQFDRQVTLGKMTIREMWNRSWDVNTTATYIVTHTFVPLLLKSSDPRLIFITSGTSTLTECDDTSIRLNQSPPKGWPKQMNSISAYRSSKTGMNMMMREWTRILREDGVKVWCISPGFLATGLGGDQEMNKKMGAQDPKIGANLVRDVVEGQRDQDIGKVVRRNDVQPW